MKAMEALFIPMIVPNQTKPNLATLLGSYGIKVSSTGLSSPARIWIMTLRRLSACST